MILEQLQNDENVLKRQQKKYETKIKRFNRKLRARLVIPKLESLSVNQRRIVGICMATVQGLISGNANTPFLFWQKENHELNSPHNILDYVFSYSLGCYIGATFFFIFMGLYKKINERSWSKPVIRPAFLVGFMYCIGYASFLLSSQSLGLGTSFVVTQIGSCALSSLWSLLYFKEITNRQGVVTMVAALTVMSSGVVLTTIAA